MGAQHRPRLELTEDYRNHILKSIQELLVGSDILSETYLLIQSLDQVESVKGVYGCFRHWGHPYINYFEGLKKLYAQTHVAKNVHSRYMELLASDLAKKVLISQYKKTKTWSVDVEKVPKNHPLKAHFMNGTFPPEKILAAQLVLYKKPFFYFLFFYFNKKRFFMKKTVFYLFFRFLFFFIVFFINI